MGQGLAPAEPATSAAASCLLRRRRRAIGAIVVCGPSLGCPFDECGAHRVRRRTCLPSAFDMNAGLKFGFGGHRQIVPRFRRTSGSRSQMCSPGIARGRLVVRTSRRSVLHCSASGTQSQQHISTIRTVSELGSTRAPLEPLHHSLHHHRLDLSHARRRDKGRVDAANARTAVRRIAANNDRVDERRRLGVTPRQPLLLRLPPRPLPEQR